MKELAIDTEHLEGLCGAALDALPRTIVVSDQERVLYANAAAAQAFGAGSAQELIGLRVDEMLHPDCHEAAAQRRALLASSRRELHDLPTKLMRRDGVPINTVADAVPIDFQGRTAFVFLNRFAVPAEHAS